MGLRLIDSCGEHERGCVMFCSTSMWAFGPVFGNPSRAESFIEWIKPIDPRELEEKELLAAHTAWQAAYDLGVLDLVRGKWAQEIGIDESTLKYRRQVRQSIALAQVSK